MLEKLEMIKMRKSNIQVKIWMSEEEYAILEKLVKETGDTKRGIILKALKNIKVMTKEQKEEMQEISKFFSKYIEQLRRIGININQIAARANTLGYKHDYKKLEELQEEVTIIKEESELLWRSLRWLISQAKVTRH